MANRSGLNFYGNISAKHKDHWESGMSIGTCISTRLYARVSSLLCLAYHIISWPTLCLFNSPVLSPLSMVKILVAHWTFNCAILNKKEINKSLLQTDLLCNYIYIIYKLIMILLREIYYKPAKPKGKRFHDDS